MDYLACCLDLSLPSIVISPSESNSLPHVEFRTKISYAGLRDKTSWTGAISTTTNAGQEDSEEAMSKKKGPMTILRTFQDSQLSR
jgi:hypothetical protein